MATVTSSKTARGTADRGAWVTGVAAACILGVSCACVRRLAARGRLTVRDLGVKARYSRESVEALARSSVHAAHAGDPL